MSRTHGEDLTIFRGDELPLADTRRRQVLMKRSTSERGAALVTVMLAITLLTILVVEFAYSTQIDQHLAYNALRSLQATYLTRSGINFALLALKKDGQASGIDTLGEDWGRALPPLPAGEGTVTIRITDEQGN
jgi:general secretion pathway protein K